MDKKNRMAGVAEVLGGGLPPKLACRLPGPGLLRAWRRVAGQTVAQRAWPVCLEPDGALVLAVSGTLWRQELALRLPELLASLAQEGQPCPGLKLVLARTPPPPPPPAPEPPPLTPQDHEAIGQALAGVADPELRQALASLMAAQVQARRAAGLPDDPD